MVLLVATPKEMRNDFSSCYINEDPLFEWIHAGVGNRENTLISSLNAVNDP